MNIWEARKKAEELMELHGLTQKGWTFKFDKARVRFGLCSIKKKQISMSGLLTSLNSEEEVIDTILHEIAHALAGKGHGHDRVWKQKCIEVGCRPIRCYDSKKVIQPKMKYTYACSGCDFKVGRMRKIVRGSACPDCCRLYNNGRYTEEFKLHLMGE